jgi:hypothetical protein
VISTHCGAQNSGLVEPFGALRKCNIGLNSFFAQLRIRSVVNGGIPRLTGYPNTASLFPAYSESMGLHLPPAFRYVTLMLNIARLRYLS